MTFYSIHHVTTFHYSDPISESIMEARLQPRTEGNQRCLRFQMVISPKASASVLHDYMDNIVHTFDIPGAHDRLAITTEAVVEVMPAPELPEALSPETWASYDEISAVDFDLYDMLQPGKYTHPTKALAELAHELNLIRRDDPLTLLREMTATIYNAFDYDQDTTNVYSHIDVALKTRRGVCQDFVHIMLTLLRQLHIPCRYVSGYLFHRENGYDRSANDATHAWVEAWLPEYGWIGFDPTNNLICDDHHIRVAIGHDYADVPPTKGVFRGAAESTLKVAVQVKRIEFLPVIEETLISPVDWSIETQTSLMQQQQIQQQ
jgi:transglutaminase-like putative cysteine protease